MKITITIETAPRGGNYLTEEDMKRDRARRERPYRITDEPDWNKMLRDFYRQSSTPRKPQ